MKQKLNCILLIDDDEPTNFLSSLLIEEADCTERIQVAQSGRKALEYLEATGCIESEGTEMQCPDLIFLDINMPAMNGWEFLENYKKLDKAQQSKMVIIMLTTSLNPADKLMAENMPEVSGFEHKPLTPEIIERVIKKYFDRAIGTAA
jgi:CheY-like chemotaxis protein